MTDLPPAPDGYPIKLVRDGTAALINSTGEPGDLFYEKLTSTDDRVLWLRKKLAEELVEYLTGPSYKELCDIVAVLDGLMLLEHGTFLVSAIRDAVHNHPRGGFRGTVMMYGRHPEFDVTDPENKLGRN